MYEVLNAKSEVQLEVRYFHFTSHHLRASLKSFRYSSAALAASSLVPAPVLELEVDRGSQSALRKREMSSLFFASPSIRFLSSVARALTGHRFKIASFTSSALLSAELDTPARTDNPREKGCEADGRLNRDIDNLCWCD